MRKRAMIVVCLLLVCLTGWAQQYPPELEGDRLVNGSLDIQAHLEEIQNPDPFGIYGPTGEDWWFGDACFTDDTATIRYYVIAKRVCVYSDDNPWGLPPGEWLDTVCYAEHPRYRISFPSIRMRWNEAASAYLETYPMKDHVAFTSLTIDWDERRMWLRQGALHGEDGVFTISEDHHCKVYVLDERSAGFRMRRPAERFKSNERERTLRRGVPRKKP
jgi:hypothetical protein